LKKQKHKKTTFLALLLFETLIARDLPEGEVLNDSDRRIIENSELFSFNFLSFTNEKNIFVLFQTRRHFNHEPSEAGPKEVLAVFFFIILVDAGLWELKGGLSFDYFFFSSFFYYFSCVWVSSSFSFFFLF